MCKICTTQEIWSSWRLCSSVKDLGKKLSAIMKMDLNPEVVLNEVK